MLRIPRPQLCSRQLAWRHHSNRLWRGSARFHRPTDVSQCICYVLGVSYPLLVHLALLTPLHLVLSQQLRCTQYGWNLAPGPPPEWKSLLTLPPEPSSSSSSSSAFSNSPSAPYHSPPPKKLDGSPEGRRDACSAEHEERALNTASTDYVS